MRLLVVEDEHSLREDIARKLRCYGPAVIEKKLVLGLLKISIPLSLKPINLNIFVPPIRKYR